MNIIITPGTAHLNVSPDAFHKWATHYLKCKNDFQSPDKFSPVPYFLLCRAIELEIKARHLKAVTQNQVKDNYGHDLEKAYGSLTPAEKVLVQEEEKALQIASDIYKRKGFEYFNIMSAVQGYGDFPDLSLLNSIANKLIKAWIPSLV